MRRAVVLIAAVVLLAGLAVAFSDPEETKPAKGNLPKDGSLRVGIKKKVECTRKSRSGRSRAALPLSC